MASFGRQFSSEAPVMALSPQTYHQDPFTTSSTNTFNYQPPHPMPQFGAQAPTSSLKATGRKRSRDEAAVNLEPDVPIQPTVPEEPEEEWIYGEGMVLIKANKGYVADAASQSGTWLEEKKAEEDANRKHHEEMLATIRSAKAQRVVHTVEAGDMPSPNSVSPLASSPAATPNEVNSGPVVDDFTLHLGIGWRRISDDSHIQAAARGWARYIENHYPITNVQIRLESKSLESYLVEANEGFFLFAEHLKEGRLVSPTVEGALKNLQSSPPVFDGQEQLLAEASSKPTQSTPTETPDMEMSMD